MTASAHDPKAPPDILSGSEIYDRIMGEIEPELIIGALPEIAKRTKDESTEKRRERADRYARAYAEYDTRFSAYCAQWQKDSHRYRNFSFHSLEDFTNSMNQTHLDTIVDSIHSA